MVSKLVDFKDDCLMNNHLPKSTTTNTVDTSSDCSWAIDMWNYNPPKDMWCPWFGLRSITSNRRLSRGYIWTLLHSTLTPVSPWLSNNHCYSETKLSLRAHIVGLCLGIVFYCTTSTCICHAYIHFLFHT